VLFHDEINNFMIVPTAENMTSEQEVKMQENPAYETPPSRIHMKKNEAYCTVTFQSSHL